MKVFGVEIPDCSDEALANKFEASLRAAAPGQAVEIPAGLDETAARAIQAKVQRAPDMVNHPPHYTSHPSGVECIQVTEHLNFCLGNAIKYIWRSSDKGDQIENLKKARWYVDREIARLEKLKA